MIGNGVVVDLDHLVAGDRRPREARGPVTRAAVPLGAPPTSSCPTTAGWRDRATGRAGRDDQARDRSRLPGQDGAHGTAPARHGSTEAASGTGSTRNWPAWRCSTRPYGRPMPRVAASRRGSGGAAATRRSAEALGPAITDTVDLLQGALGRGERVLCEGSQGTFLDIDLGSYPFVTSASTTAGGAATGLGLAPSQLVKVDRDLKGLHDARGQRPVSDGVSAGIRRRLPQERRRVRGHDGPSAAMRVARRGPAEAISPPERD